jgi:hypothetical protein
VWTDSETTDDLLGFSVHADLIRSVVVDETLLPVTIGIFGDWGGGKTSVLRMLERDLDPNSWEEPAEKAKYEKVGCLYINGWLFEGYDDAKSALLSAVLLALGEHKRFGPKARDKVVSLLKSVNYMRVARLGLKEVALPAIAAYVTGGASLLPSAAAALGKLAGGVLGTGAAAPGGEEAASADGSNIDWESLIKEDASSASPLDVRSFRDRFEKLLADSDIGTLVVLIDDLDRCEPDRIIDNLEAIKLFLNVPRTAFVIGADPRIVRHAIAHRYGAERAGPAGEADEAEDRLVTDYLEKLIQVPYGLPRLSPAETETYMTLLFCRRHLDGDGFGKCLVEANKRLGDNRYGVFGLAAVRGAIGAAAVPKELDESLTFSAKAAPLITEGLKGNPRQVKRFLNAFALRKQLAKIAHLDHLRDEILVKLMILEYAQPQRFRELFGWQAAQAGRPAEIRNLEAAWRDGAGAGAAGDGVAADVAKGWNSEFAKRWVRMDPPLSSEDLRDYFWVARDKLASTLAGVSLIPPAVRRVLDDLLSGNPGRMKQAASGVGVLGPENEAVLIEALSSHLVRHPEAEVGYDAVRQLVEAGVLGAADAIVMAAPQMATGNIPASVGLDLRMLVTAHPALRDLLQPILDGWAGTDTQVGRALQSPPARGRR